MGIPIIVEGRSDALSLRRYVKNTGRAYQRQAIELVNICRIFLETPSQKERRDAILKSTVLAIIEALRSATEAGKCVTSEASNAFEAAKEKLLQCRARVHPGLHSLDATINERMTRAKTTDARHLGLFNQLREKRGPQTPEDLPRKSTMMGVNLDNLSDSAVLSALPQSSSHPRGALSTIPQEPWAGMSEYIGDMAPRLPLSPSLPTPSPLTCADSPSNLTNIAPMPDPKDGNETTQRPPVDLSIVSDALSRSVEKRRPPTRGQTELKWPSRDVRSLKPSLRFMPTSMKPTPLKTKSRQPTILTMPGAFPEMPLDVDISSWILVSPVSSAEVWKISWVRRLFT